MYREKIHLQIVYIGAMNSGYDLHTVVSFAEKWKKEGEIPLQIHFAGKGDLLNKLMGRSKKLGLLESSNNKNQKSKIKLKMQKFLISKISIHWS